MANSLTVSQKKHSPKRCESNWKKIHITVPSRGVIFILYFNITHLIDNPEPQKWQFPPLRMITYTESLYFYKSKMIFTIWHRSLRNLKHWSIIRDKDVSSVQLLKYIIVLPISFSCTNCVWYRTNQHKKATKLAMSFLTTVS